MKLIIAEKPSLGRSIADAIPGTASGKDPIYKGDYCVTWLYGHILTLQEPQDYDTKYEKWSIEQLPIFFEGWKQKPSDGKESRLEQIGTLLQDADTVIHAGDPDDEGQLLVDEVLRWFHYTGPVKRLDTANTTKAALTRALKSMQDNGPRENDGWAAYARSVADLMIGVNMSRFFTCLNRGKTLSVGRVQTPTLGLVVARDQLIEQHQKTVYYTLGGTLIIDGKDVPYTLQLDKNDPRLTDGKLTDEQIAKDILMQLSGMHLNNILISTHTEQEQPPLPFNLVKLQTYCGNAWGYDPQKVMDITQRLKDSGAITYNRSDCQYLSSDHFKEAPKTVPTVLNNLGLHPKALDTSIRSAAFNDNNITAHFAIIPTDSTRDLSRFTEEERNVYTIIARYYLAQFLPPCTRKKTALKCELKDIGTLTSSSSVVTDQGFHELLPAKIEPPTVLSDFADGTYSGDISDIQAKAVETKPPARYTKTSLNEDMTRIARYVEDEEVKKLLLEKDKDKKGENGSIGTSATRATIIDALILRGFLMEKNRKLISTELGREFYHVLPDEIKKPDMTAYWWVLQEQIKSGEIPYSRLSDSVLETIRKILGQQFPLMNSAAKIPADRKIVGRCPRCGGYVVSGNKGYGCMNYKNGCKFTIWKNSKSSLMKNITITDKMAEALLNGDVIETKKLWSEDKKTNFFGGLQLHDQGADYGAELQFVPMKKGPIGVCPLCGGNVTENKLSFGCENYTSGCKFTIWKNPKGSLWKNITITESMARKLLKGETVSSKKLWSEGKQTAFFGGFKLELPIKSTFLPADAENAENADAPVRQNMSLQLVQLEREPIGACPLCGGNVMESRLAFGCENYASGCRFTVWKNPKGSVWKNITISEGIVKKLLAGETIPTKHLWSEAKQSDFYGGYRLKLSDAPTEAPQAENLPAETEAAQNAPSGKPARTCSLELVMLERPPLGNCPRCGNPVIEGKNGFGCSGYKNGCKFVIWKKAKTGYLQNMTITETMAKKLLSGESVKVTKLTKKGFDRPLPGTITLKDSGGDYGAEIAVEFDAMPSLGVCPRCGKPVVESGLSYSCSGWSEGCRFTIWKKSKLRMFSDINITAEMASKLIAGESVHTDLLYSEKKEKHFPGELTLRDKGGEYGADLTFTLTTQPSSDLEPLPAPFPEPAPEVGNEPLSDDIITMLFNSDE